MLYTRREMASLLAGVPLSLAMTRQAGRETPGLTTVDGVIFGVETFSFHDLPPSGVGNCASCHSPVSDLAGISRKYDAATLRSRLLRPGPAMPIEGAAAASGYAAHLRLLENYTRANVDNLLAYLQTLMTDR